MVLLLPHGSLCPACSPHGCIWVGGQESLSSPFELHMKRKRLSARSLHWENRDPAQAPRTWECRVCTASQVDTELDKTSGLDQSLSLSFNSGPSSCKQDGFWLPAHSPDNCTESSALPLGFPQKPGAGTGHPPGLSLSLNLPLPRFWLSLPSLVYFSASLGLSPRSSLP